MSTSIRGSVVHMRVLCMSSLYAGFESCKLKLISSSCLAPPNPRPDLADSEFGPKMIPNEPKPKDKSKLKTART